MKVVYPVIFTEVEKKVLIYIPSFNRMSEGDSFADAIDMARDYIANALYDKTSSQFPLQSDSADIKESPFYENGKTFVSLVDVDLDFFRMKEKSKTVRRNITIPEWLDKMATAANINVSEVSREALKSALCV